MQVMFRGQYIGLRGVQFCNHTIVSLLFTYGHVGVIEPGLVLGRFASIKWLGLKSASSCEVIVLEESGLPSPGQWRNRV